MKRFFIPLAALFSLVAPALTRAAPPIYPGVVPYEQLDTRNFYLGNYPILRIMPFMPKDTPPYLPVDTWSFAINTNLWTLYAYDPPNTTWHQVLGLGGIAVTINPTDNYTPYRIDATTFGDSMLRYRASGSDLGAPTAGGGTSVYAGATGIFNVGLESGQNGDFTGSLNIFNYGYRAGQNGIWTTVASSYNLGTDAGSNMTMLPGANNIYNFGDLAGSSSIYKVSSEIYNLGVYAGASSRSTNSYEIYNIGADAGQSMIASNSFDIYNIGSDANKSQTFISKSHMFALGSGSTTTNTGDFVFGDNLYHYWLPGQIYSPLYFGPGVTNLLSRFGTDLWYETTRSGSRIGYFGVTNATDGFLALLGAGGNLAQVRGNAGVGLFDDLSSGREVRWGLNIFAPIQVNSQLGADLLTTSYPWGVVNAYTNYNYSFRDGTATNYLRLETSASGETAIFDIQSLTNNVLGPITGYSFRTNGVEILSISGPGGGGGGLLSQLLWTNSPTGGGSLTASSNVIASLPTGLYGSIFNNSEDIFAAGENAGQGQAVIQSTNLYNIGLLSGYGMTGNEAWMVMNFGDAAGRSATIYNSQDVYNFGIAPGELAQITNGSWVVMNIGDNAGYAMVTDKAQDIFNYGWLSGDSMGVSNSIAIFNYGDWAGKNPVSTIQNSQDIFNYGNAAGGDQIPQNSTNLFNYGLYAGGAQFVQTVNSYYNYGTDSGYMGVGLASNSEELYNYGAWAGASLAALVADGTFVNFTNVYNYGPEAGMQIKGTNATYVLNYGYRAGEQSTMTGVSDLYNYGSDSGFQSTYDTSATDIYNYGTSAGKGASYTNSFFILNSGNSAGQSMVAQDSSSILNLGSYAGANMVATNSSSIVNIGPYAGNLSTLTNSSYVISYGDQALKAAVLTNSSEVYAYGYQALYQAQLTNSSQVYAYGNQSGASLAGDGYSDIYLFGTAQPTRKTNEFVFGDANYLSTFPGLDGVHGDHFVATNNVKAFGAKGDGITDDTTALLAAVSYVNTHPGILLFPIGTYLCGSPLLFTNQYIVVQGEGWKSIIQSTIASTKPLMCVSNQAFTLRDIQLNPINGTTYGLVLTNAARSLFTNVRIQPPDASTASCIYSKGSFICQFINVHLDGGTVGFYDGGENNGCVFQGGEVRDNNGFDFSSGSGSTGEFTIQNSVIEATDTGAYAIRADNDLISMLNVKDCYFEGNVGGGIYIGNIVGANITGNRFDSTGLGAGNFMVSVVNPRTTVNLAGNISTSSSYIYKFAVPVRFSGDNWLSGVNSPYGIASSARIITTISDNLWPDPDLLAVNQSERFISSTSLIFARDTTTKRLNKASVSVTETNANGNQRWVLPLRVLNATQGQTVTAGCWAKSADANVRIRIQDSSGGQTSDVGSFSADNEWRLVQCRPYTVNAAATYLRVYLYIDAVTGTNVTANVGDFFLYKNITANTTSGSQAALESNDPVIAYCDGFATWDPGTLSTGTQSTKAVTVPGAAFGQAVSIIAPYDFQACTVTGYVSAANTVTILIRNDTGGNITFVSGDWYVESRYK